MSVTKGIAERVAIVETKQDAMIACIDEIKVNVKDMHDCLDNTRDGIMEKLEEMKAESNKQHDEIHKKISAMEKLKDKYTYMVMGGIVVISWVSAHADKILTVLK